LSPGTRRNGSNKFGPFNAPVGERRAQSGPGPRGDRDNGYTGRHASPRPKKARTRAGQAVPAAAAAATLAAGAAVYTLAGGGQPQAAQLNAAMIQPTTASVTVAGRAQVDATTMIKASAAARAAASQATASQGTASQGTATHPAGATPSATTARPSAPSHKAGAAAHPAAAAHAAPGSPLSCNLNYSKLPQNVTAIVSFLLAHGYSHNAAAGIAGNIYQESKGDPEAVGMGGGGLIGWTPLRPGLITGNPAADLKTQLAAVLVYNEGWSSYLPALNAAASPASAAYIYVTDFERAGIPAAWTRETSAANVARACGL
jgi:hypothetical protein